jgi:hypothetical protein
MWDFGTGKLINEIPWNKKGGKGDDPINLYSCCFSKQDSSVIIAGGSNPNEVKLFDRND